MRQYALLQRFGLATPGLIFYNDGEGFYKTKEGNIILSVSFVESSPDWFEIYSPEKRWSNSDLRFFAKEIMQNIGHGKTIDEIIKEWRAKK